MPCCACFSLATHAKWGRLQETFTEDPYLSSRLAVAYVRGMQSPQWGHGGRYVEAGATCKVRRALHCSRTGRHLPASHSLLRRCAVLCFCPPPQHFFSYGSSNQTELNHLVVSETDLRQTYFPSFEACIREGLARSIMVGS